jgi:hemolysin activation/secretion protein
LTKLQALIRIVFLLALLKGQDALAGAVPSPGETNAPTFEVKGYLIEGNDVLPPERLKLLDKYTGPAVTMSRLAEGLGELQLLYRSLGFATVSVTLPQQHLTNGMVHVKVIAGKLTQITVQGNRFFTSNSVMRALPSLQTNVLLNTKWFQPELDRANANLDRQIYPVLSPGVEAGTTDLALTIKDQLPLHGHVELNDKGVPLTPSLRVDTALQYDNLWQRDHQVGLDYNFSPQQMKPDGANPALYDQPAVASYSGYYRIPLSFGPSLRESYSRLPVDFGYDEVTHRFNLPAATGGPELVFYASQSTVDSGSHLGPVSTITNSATLDVFTQTALRSPTVTGNLGSRYILPLPPWDGILSSLTFGWDYKSYQIGSLATNFTTIQLFSTNPPSLLHSAIVTNGQVSGHRLYYMPLSLGLSATLPDKWGSTSFNYNQNIFLSGLQSSRSEFQAVAGAKEAGGNFATATAGLTRELLLPGDWSAILNANGQWSSQPLIGNEQFALGGTSGVRGYLEGETYGDCGWRTLFDLRAPAANIGSFPTESGGIPAFMRCSWFMDYGQSYHLAQHASAAVREWGTGLGFYWTAGDHAEARLTLGVALNDTPATVTGDLRAYLSIGTKF